ncbi:hypothetical protein CVT26_014766 [Gymnopilus dilepis]|uniref:Uncharacterized protein n=1 Tax=Gymnopilus dilepis TaxID=231916 RepID=A0A409WXJ6_9AGAR|nr:hypothetical protein CVT26_014766 [Gymnopilus dilepis]
MTSPFPACRRLALSSRLSGAPSRSTRSLCPPSRASGQCASTHGRPSTLRVSGRRHSSTNAKARPQQKVPTPSSSPLPPPPVSSLPPNLKHDLRMLLRELAQPVAVLTSLMPPPSSSRPSSPNAPKPKLKPSKKENKLHRPSTHGPSPPLYHGATLSSFTSIAMDPYPLVCFALRVPSRMADGLREAVEQEERDNKAMEAARVRADEAARAREMARAKEGSAREKEEVREDGTIKLGKHRKWRAPPDPDRAHMVINLLSRGQEEAAVRFSRPDLYPTPFAEPLPPRPPSPSPSPSSSSSPNPKSHTSHRGKREPNLPTPTPCTLSKEGFPILLDSLGALSCRLVAGPIPLHDVNYLSQLVTDSPSSFASPPGKPLLGKGEVASQLFIARVVRVEDVPRLGEGKEGEELKPLIYHRRGYTTCEEGEQGDS